MTYDDLLKQPAYALPQTEKDRYLLALLSELMTMHEAKCPAYGRFLHAWNVPAAFESVADIPFVPVGAFKKRRLLSIAEENVFRELTSSGTSGGQASRIYLDRATAAFQQQTLYQILAEKLGTKRLPMLIIDSPAVLRDRTLFSARGAGIVGFSMMSKKRFYALDEEMHLDINGIQSFLRAHADERILVFGFTFMVLQYFAEVLRAQRIKLSMENAVLFHGGGWKKMKEKAVSASAFKEALAETAGIQKVYDYYGMAEQTGSIYVECEEGHLHASAYSDVLFRRARDFSICDAGEEGIVQVLSPMALSYPGHSILTQDLGVLCGRDDCPCGRKGAYFHITGRIPQAQVRGCSDTYGT